MSLLAAALLMTVAGAANDDDALARLRSRAEACITGNAASVEKNQPSLTDAVSFLLENLCVAPINALGKYKANTALRSQMSSQAFSGELALFPGVRSDKYRAALEQQKQRYKDAKVDRETGRLVFADNTDGELSAALDDLPITPAGASSELRAFAARAVLDARQSRLAH